VIRADDPAAFLAAFRRIAALLHTPEVAHGAGDWGRQILVEDFIPGREIALEGILTRDGLRVLALFDKPEPLDGPYFEETIYVTPSRLPPAVQDAVAGCAARAAESIGLRHGPIHAELRLNEAGPWLVEVAARSIGGRCSRILRFGVDTSLEELILRHALGLPVPSFQREDSAAGVMMVPIPGAGRLRAVEGLERAREVQGIEDVEITAPVGERVVPLPGGASYLGFIYARGSTPGQVVDALHQAHRCLQFRIEPELPLAWE
jgi:hypothetical protein